MTLAGLLSLATAPVLGDEGTRACAGIRLPGSVFVDGVRLHRNGAGPRRVGWLGVGFDVYVAALYLERRTPDAGAVLADLPHLHLALHFVRGVERARLTEGFDEAFAEAIEREPDLREKQDRLNAWMRDLPEGSVLAFTHRPGEGLEVQVDDRPLGIIEGEGFARVLLAHWLREDGVQASLARALFGGACG